MEFALNKGEPEPMTEDLIKNINELQKAKELLCDHLDEHKARCEAVTKELDEREGERTHLAELYEKKQESLHLLQFQCEQKVSDNQRKQQLSEYGTERIQNWTSKIQEEKLKQRKQRLEFEKQLDELMKKHKSLWEFHEEKRLTLEMIQMGDRKNPLLTEENEEKNKLSEASEAAEKLRQEDAARTAEDAFLRSQAAEIAVHLLKEENADAKATLEAASERQARGQEEYSRLRDELEAAGVDLESLAEKTL